LDADHSDHGIKEGIVADSGGGGQTQGGSDFGVDLQALSDAIATVQREKDNISGTLDQIDIRIRNLSAYWAGPAYDSVDPVTTWYDNARYDLMGILEEIIARMKKSYDNYHQAESQNAENVTPRVQA
jgi:WXG100 family type VII secretion target